MASVRIPLFPLEVVLFPGGILPLHIFEPRYKKMIGECLEQKSRFGVILAMDKGLPATGCTAEITAVLKRYSDGRMDILTRGESVFSVRELLLGKPCFEAHVNLIADPPAHRPAAKELRDLFEQCFWMAYRRAPETQGMNANAFASYFMAGSLPLPLEQKQSLLELRDEGARQALLESQLKTWLPQLAEWNECREAARGKKFALN